VYTHLPQSRTHTHTHTHTLTYKQEARAQSLAYQKPKTNYKKKTYDGIAVTFESHA